MFTIEQLEKLSIKVIYREFLKNMKFYPSKNRFQLLLAIKEDFRANRTLIDPKQLQNEKKKAMIGLRHVLLYKEKNIELKANYRIADQGFVESMNKRGKDFIFF